MTDPRIGSERHWEAVYGRDGGGTSVSWYQAVPAVSLELIDELGVPRSAALIDVGGGASLLADRLVERGFTDVTVLDIALSALAEVGRRLGNDTSVKTLHRDLLDWEPERAYDVWHERAVFHFLVGDADRRRYLRTLRSTVRPGGAVIVATFADDGPDRCSRLPVSGYSAAGLAAALGDDFEPLLARREEHVTPGGLLQPFTWLAGRMRAT